ncbi:MAG TPA: hypothetical protein VHM72_06350 [Solirubrobacteraceae bacterium]|nr:hypothetical protein [Solirubrobacteraceae bacterium]
MTRKLYSPLLVALASAALLAGCGSSSKTPPTTPKKTAPAKTTPASTKPASTTPASTTPAGGLTAAELKSAGAACRSALTHIPATFGSAAKSDLSSVCSDLSSGNLTAAKSDAEKYCVAIVAAVPAADKPLARDECNAIGKSF